MAADGVERIRRNGVARIRMILTTTGNQSAANANFTFV